MKKWNQILTCIKKNWEQITDGINFVLQRENSIKLSRTELKHEGFKGIKNGWNPFYIWI